MFSPRYGDACGREGGSSGSSAAGEYPHRGASYRRCAACRIRNRCLCLPSVVFPSLGEYAARLEAAGFQVDMAVHFTRPTVLPDGDAGMDYWLESFAKPFVPAVGEKESGRLFRLVKERCRSSLYSGDEWTLDYARLRFAAHKTLRE